MLRLPCWSAAAEPKNSRCSLPGDSDCGNDHDRHVEIEGVHALLVLRDIDRAERRGDADPLQILDEGQDDPLHLRVVEQDLELEGLAGLVVDQLARP